jgi:5'-nucleotidase
MLILLTNDDGIRAPGIAAMYRQVKTLGETHVIAPETVQSATSHGITLDVPLLTSRVKVQNAFEGISVHGRPADCVKIAVDQLLPRKPDLAISGLNAGANAGIAVIYSGTVAAAIEAAFLGVPSIAVSVHMEDRQNPPDFEWAAEIARGVIENVLAAGLGTNQVANINVPCLPAGKKPAGIKVVRQCTVPWIDSYERRTDPQGRDYFWNSSYFSFGTSEADTDMAALRDGYVTVTPLQFDLTNGVLMKKWGQRKWE